MPGKAQAVTSGTALRTAVASLAASLGLTADEEVYVGRRIWGSQRKIDVIMTDPETRRRLGVECKFQGTGGSAEEKIPATIDDIRSWPIDGIVVFSGSGFSNNMK